MTGTPLLCVKINFGWHSCCKMGFKHVTGHAHNSVGFFNNTNWCVIFNSCSHRDCNLVASGIYLPFRCVNETKKTPNGAAISHPSTLFRRRSASLRGHAETGESRGRHVGFTSDRSGEACVFWAPRCDIGFGHPARVARSSWRKNETFYFCCTVLLRLNCLQL